MWLTQLRGMPLRRLRSSRPRVTQNRWHSCSGCFLAAYISKSMHVTKSIAKVTRCNNRDTYYQSLHYCKPGAKNMYSRGSASQRLSRTKRWAQIFQASSAAAVYSCVLHLKVHHLAVEVHATCTVGHFCYQCYNHGNVNARMTSGGI